MHTVAPFSPAMISDFLTRSGLEYFSDGQTRFVALFGPHRERPFELRVQLSADGTNLDIFVVRVGTPHHYRPEDGPALLALANRWHRSGAGRRCTSSRRPT
jgi:hypothetical protein